MEAILHDGADNPSKVCQPVITPVSSAAGGVSDEPFYHLHQCEGFISVVLPHLHPKENASFVWQLHHQILLHTRAWLPGRKTKHAANNPP